MPFVVLHTADVHLDRAFSAAGMSAGIAAARRQELRDAFRRFVDLAVDSKVDAVTIGGDLYEHERATMDTGHFLREQLERLGPVPALVSPGNHDPYMPDSLYARMDWPPNVTIFREPAFRPVQFSPWLTVWGAGHDGPTLRRNLLEGFRVEGAGRHVLLFHGSDTRAVPPGKPAHCPFLASDVRAAGADFALLGHYHGARVAEDSAPVFAYPGSPEPLDFSEEGVHHILRLDIDEARISPTLIPFSRVPYCTHTVEVSAFLTSESLRAAITALPGEGEIVRVILAGMLQPEVDLDVQSLYNSCAERFRYLEIVDRTEPGYDFAELAEESTTKGAFVRLMLTRIQRLSPDDRGTAEAALLYGLRAFERREVSA